MRKSNEGRRVGARVEVVRAMPEQEFISIEDRRTPLGIRINKYLEMMMSHENYYQLKIAAFNLSTLRFSFQSFIDHISHISLKFCLSIVEFGAFERALEKIHEISNRSEASTQVVTILFELLAYLLEVSFVDFVNLPLDCD